MSSMLLGSFVAVSSVVVASRAVNAKVTEDMNEKILSEGLYHVTKKENVEAILKSKYIKPSGNITSYGKKRCFFFGGLPNANDFFKNVSNPFLNYEYDALKIDINKDENGNDIGREEALKRLSNFKQRILNDDAITYKGKCMLNDKCCSHVTLVYDLDKEKNIVLREKTQEEIENGYTPTQEVLQFLAVSNNSIINTVNRVKGCGSVYTYEAKNTFKRIFEVIKEKLTRKPKNLMLNSGVVDGNANRTDGEKRINNPNFINGLKSDVMQKGDIESLDEIRVSDEEKLVKNENFQSKDENLNR